MVGPARPGGSRPRGPDIAEVAAIVGEAIRRQVRAEQVADDDMRAALRAAGFGEVLVEAMVGMPIGLRSFEPENPRTIVTTTPTTLNAWAHEHLRPRGWTRPPGTRASEHA
jgi:NAD(P)H dehydrogenase (quinone)